MSWYCLIGLNKYSFLTSWLLLHHLSWNLPAVTFSPCLGLLTSTALYSLGFSFAALLTSSNRFLWMLPYSPLLLPAGRPSVSLWLKMSSALLGAHSPNAIAFSDIQNTPESSERPSSSLSSSGLISFSSGYLSEIRDISFREIHAMPCCPAQQSYLLIAGRPKPRLSQFLHRCTFI